jgi:hypothetical protein
MLDTIGIYNCYNGLPPDCLPFIKACGFNTYQRWDLGWTLGPAKHGGYYAEMAEDVAWMQAAGFRVYVLLNINMRQRQDGEKEGYADNGLDPADTAVMRTRMHYLVETVRKTKDADGFTIFAGDPGGHKNANPRHAFEWTRRVAELIRCEAPKAEINVNTWGIAAWDHFVSPFDVAFWEQEVRLTRELLSQSHLVGAGMGMEFPLHNYYRSLARSCYAKAGKQPALFPDRDEVQALRMRGAKRLWGWPYFVTDECDDGYPGSLPGVAQAETRYIRQIVATGRELGLNGMIANAMAENVFTESLNLFAFARFCRDAAVTPEQVILEFAGHLAEPKSAACLADVLRYIENHSTWQVGMPVPYRLPDFETGTVRSPSDALLVLSQVNLRPTGGIPLIRPAAEYIAKVKERLNMLSNPAVTL